MVNLTPFWVIVGLGNPGSKYANHRHNVGSRCVDFLAKKHSVSFSRKALAEMGPGRIDGVKVALGKPRTFMNVSGEAVDYILRSQGGSPSSLLVIYDDMDLPLGKLRIRERGRAGGHNGIKSIIAAIGTEEFPRLRIGIGRPEGFGDVIRHVLSTFSSEEQPIAEEAIKRAAEAARCILTQGIVAAMNQFN